MELSFDGIGQVAATFQTEAQEAEDTAKLSTGHVVALTAANTVGFGTAGAAPCGVVLALEGDQTAAVQVEGFARVSYSGAAAPAVGWTSLGWTEAGAYRLPAPADAALLVVQVDDAAKTAVIKL